MKRIIVLSSLVLLIMNLLCGLILSFYGGFSVAVSSIVIVVTALLLFLTDTLNLKDGFKIPLMLIFILAGFLEFILSLIAPNRIADNWWLIVVFCLLALEAILLIITNTVSNKIK